MKRCATRFCLETRFAAGVKRSLITADRCLPATHCLCRSWQAKAFIVVYRDNHSSCSIHGRDEGKCALAKLRCMNSCEFSGFLKVRCCYCEPRGQLSSYYCYPFLASKGTYISISDAVPRGFALLFIHPDCPCSGAAV